jgi:hypothetical protein
MILLRMKVEIERIKIMEHLEELVMKLKDLMKD